MIFDWPSSPGWTAGAPSAGQTKTQSFTSVTTNDITVSINNSGAASKGMVNQTGYPAIDSTNETGGFSGVNGLQLYVSSSQVATAYLRTTVSFATPITNLSFQLWDVDALAGQFVDKVSNIQALASGGGTVGATTVSSAVSGYNTITGTGLSTVITGTAGGSNTTNQGSIDVAFNTPITQFSFDWSNSDAGRGAQAIGLSQLTYTVVPEFTSAFLPMALCIGAVLAEQARRRRRSGH